MTERLRRQPKEAYRPVVVPLSCIIVVLSVSLLTALHLNSRLHIKSPLCTKSPFVGIQRKAVLHQKAFRS